MRLNGEISYWNEEEKENEMGSVLPPPLPQQKLVVGYALTSKKVKSFLQPKLEGLARKKGILFVAIDQSRPLSEQGPFDIVLHKTIADGQALFFKCFLQLTGKEWQQVLERACSFLCHES